MNIQDLKAENPGADIVRWGIHALTLRDGAIEEEYWVDAAENITVISSNRSDATALANLETNVKAVAAKVGILPKDIV